jgi:hypothetical protein
VAAVTCAQNTTYACPCTGPSCELHSIDNGEVGGGPCSAERSALGACNAQDTSSHGEVSGTRAACQWSMEQPETRCFPVCHDALNYFSAECDGPPGGPFRCSCELNGVPIIDDAAGTIQTFLADDCQGAGQAMADGKCFEGLNCCFTWSESSDAGSPVSE